MEEATAQTGSKLGWREISTWAAVVIALVGILPTYWETRSANEREIVVRVGDDAWELYRSSLDFPGNSSESRVSIAMRLLSSINVHTGLIHDRSLVEAALVGQSSVVHRPRKRCGRQGPNDRCNR